MRTIKALPILLFLLAPVVLRAQIKHVSKSGAGYSHSRLAMSIANGKIVYTQYCLPCHMADGAGVPTMNPPLIKSTYVLGDKTQLVKIVLNGFNEDVEINGQTYSNTMTAHDMLTDKQIADVLTYVRNSFTNKASAVTVSFVRGVRAENKK